ncbi:MAG: kinase [Candidatus Dormibacteraeota bacterium]|nr:kinase [Candidatus Dormibacteraeota bacterium]
MTELALPTNLLAGAQAEGWQGWLATLPETIGRLRAAWSIEVGEPFQPGGLTAWVAPAGRAGEKLVLKVLRRHPEAEHEAEALRVWAGNGAVRLHEVEVIDAQTTALLLERCRPGTPLSLRPEPEQDPVVAGLLRRLWRPPPPGHGFPTLQSMCEEWAGEFEEKIAGRGTSLDQGLVREGIALFRRLPGDAEREVLLCTDLHAGNVLAAEREPWLAIDPKPHVGDPTYDALQHMLNCDARLRADPHGLARRMAGLLGLAPDRLLLWLFARCVQESADWPNLAEVARRVAP